MKNGQNCTIVERALEIEAREESVSVSLPPTTRTNLTIYTYTLYTYKLNSFALMIVSFFFFFRIYFKYTFFLSHVHT